MKRIATTMMVFFILAAYDGAGQTQSASGASQPAPVQDSRTISVARSESLQSNKGSAQYFTGAVEIQQLFPALDPSRTNGGKVTFAQARGAPGIVTRSVKS